MIAIYRNQLLRINSFEQRGHLLMIWEAESINPSGVVSIIRSQLIDPTQLRIIKASKREREIVKKTLSHPRPRPPSPPKARKERVWCFKFKPSPFLETSKQVKFEIRDGEIIQVKENELIVKSKGIPREPRAIIEIDGQRWPIKLDVISYGIDWKFSEELEKERKRSRKRKKGGGSHGRKK